MTREERSAPEESRRRSATRNVVEALLLYAAIPAATMYPLGLLVLWLQISYTYGETLSASWFAANLVPRTALTGMGFTAIWDLLSHWLYLAALGIIVTFIALWSRRIGRRQRGIENLARIEEDLARIEALDNNRIEEINEELDRQKKELARRKVEREKLAAGLQRAVRIPLIDAYWAGPRWALVLLSLLWLSQVAGWVWLASQGRWAEAVSQALLLTTTIAGALILDRDAREAEQNLLSKYRWFLRGLAVAFVGVLTAAAFESGIRDPALPKVLLESQDGPVEGAFLAHQNNYWYVFDQDGVFRAIPNDESGEVRFVEPGGV